MNTYELPENWNKISHADFWLTADVRSYDDRLWITQWVCMVVAKYVYRDLEESDGHTITVQMLRKAVKAVADNMMVVCNNDGTVRYIDASGVVSIVITTQGKMYTIGFMVIENRLRLCLYDGKDTFIEEVLKIYLHQLCSGHIALKMMGLYNVYYVTEVFDVNLKKLQESIAGKLSYNCITCDEETFIHANAESRDEYDLEMNKFPTVSGVDLLMRLHEILG